MIRKKIKDIGTVYSGATPRTNIEEYWNGDIAWVTPKEISKLNSQFLNQTERYITESGLKSCSANMLPKGSILFTSRAPIGLLAINNIEVCTNQGFKSIVLKDGFSSLYVYYFLKTQVKQLNDLGTGSTFKELSKSTFEKFEIPIPENFVDQIRIAEVLKEVEKLIQQRKESIDLLDDFLKSTFLDMFGDPLVNNKRWDKLTLDNFFKIEDGDRGKNYPSQNEIVNKGILFLNTSNFKKNELKFDKTNFITLDKFDKLTKGKLKRKDLIITLRGSIGNVVIFDNPKYETGFINAQMAILRPKTSNVLFSHRLLINESVQNIFKSFSSGSAQPQLPITQLKKVSLINPPLKLQNKFASIVEKAENVKEKYVDSLKELENLFGSLSQKAFKGELDLSKLDVRAQIREIEKKIEAESGLEISLETKLTKPMQQFIKQTTELQKRLALADKMVPKSLYKQIETINKLAAPLQAYKAFQIPEALSEAMKSFDGIKSITSQLNQEAKEKFNTKLTWEEVNFEMVANWIKEEYSEYHFNSEILMNFLENERVTFSNYHSSEELKTNPKLNEEDDIKSFIFSALKGNNQFIKLEQFFYDAVSENVQLKLRNNDYEIIRDKKKALRSGIYFKVVE